MKGDRPNCNRKFAAAKNHFSKSVSYSLDDERAAADSIEFRGGSLLAAGAEEEVDADDAAVVADAAVADAADEAAFLGSATDTRALAFRLLLGDDDDDESRSVSNEASE